MSKNKFPKVLYVKRENTGTGDEFLSADADYGVHAESNDTVEIAVYRLERVRKIVNKSELVD